jgi:beta-lactam-binding protein with PASTA domain
MMYRIAQVLLVLMLLPLRTAQWLRRHREWLLTAMGMLAVMLISSGITVRFALHVREVTVPELTGKTMTEASQGALASGVDLVVENRFYSTTVPAGRVLSQSPVPDTVVRHGWQVRVTESLGPQQVTIPNVVGETLRDASVDVRRDELDLGTLARVEAPGEVDMVLAQTPPPDAGVDQPRINLLLSTAPAMSTNAIVLPSFLGLTSAGAIRAASELGLIVGGVGDGPVVTAQAPGEGARVVRGDAVRVSLGGTSVTMPAMVKAVAPSAAPPPGVPNVPAKAGALPVVPAPVKPAANAPAKKAALPPGPISLQIPN